MKATLDTNVLVRLMMGDDEAQQAKAVEVLEAAEVVAVSVHSLCEFSWVLGRSYGVERADIASAIRHILDLRNVVTDRPMVEAGPHGGSRLCVQSPSDASGGREHRSIPGGCRRRRVALGG